MATITLQEMRFYAHHGCFAEEQTIGTHFKVNVSFETDTSLAEQSDSISDTVNYLSVYQVVKREMETPSHLLEHVARRIIDALLAEFPAMEKVKVAVSKLNPPLGGPLEAVTVALESGRK